MLFLIKDWCFIQSIQKILLFVVYSMTITIENSCHDWSQNGRYSTLHLPGLQQFFGISVAI